MDIHLEVYVKNLFASFSPSVFYEETQFPFCFYFGSCIVFLIKGFPFEDKFIELFFSNVSDHHGRPFNQVLFHFMRWIGIKALELFLNRAKLIEFIKFRETDKSLKHECLSIYKDRLCLLPVSSWSCASISYTRGSTIILKNCDTEFMELSENIKGKLDWVLSSLIRVLWNSSWTILFGVVSANHGHFTPFHNVFFPWNHIAPHVDNCDNSYSQEPTAFL